MNEIKYDKDQPKEGLESQPLPEHIHDDSNDLDYTLVDGHYYLPDLLPEDEEYSPGIWARRYLHYLKEYRPSLLASMRSYNPSLQLSSIDRDAEELHETLVAQMAKREGLTEKLKTEDPIAWVGLANSIRHRAEEIVKAEVIYS